MTSNRDALPLQQTKLLRRAMGETLVDIERWFVLNRAQFEAYAGEGAEYFSRSSGATTFSFSGGVIHSLCGWPSQLSIRVWDESLRDDPDAERHTLSEADTAPKWLRDCIGQRVIDVRVYVYDDDVPSDEAKQVALSYVFDSGVELVFCTYLHGQMDDEEILRGDEISRQNVVAVVSLRATEADDVA